MPDRIKVRAPASSANLGPGFDALGLALDLWNELEIELGGTETSVHYDGRDAALLDDRENLSLTSMRLLAERSERTLPPLRMTVRADVPVARGLGSSAASIVAGLLAVDAILDLHLSPAEIFSLAAEMEGHGD